MRAHSMRNANQILQFDQTLDLMENFTGFTTNADKRSACGC